MATFKVGDRVRVVAVAIDMATCGYLLGKVGTIVGPSRGGVFEYVVNLDGHTSQFPDGLNRFFASDLAPLTPPEVESWAADAVRKVTKPQHLEPVAPKVTA